MFKLGQKKKDLKNENEQLVVVKKDNWIKRHFIVVPNTTTPAHLKEYQKLIVLRKPEGEKRVVVDFSLTDEQLDKLHYQSLESDYIDLNDKDIFRIIPTNINTKEIDDSSKLSHAEIEELNSILSSSAEEFRKFDRPELDEEYVSIFRMEDKNVKIIDDSFYKAKKDDGFPLNHDCDDIDSVVIKTDEQKELRETWKDVDKFLSEREEVENRLKGETNKNVVEQTDYIPGPQPLFRNFVDTDFFKIPAYNSEDDPLNREIIPRYESYDESKEEYINKTFENDHIVYEAKDANDTIEVSDAYETTSGEHEDPELVSTNMLNETKNMSDYIQEVPNSENVESIEQPVTLSFFKNKVSSTPSVVSGGGQHIPKHLKFYKSDREFRYEKVILNKKKKMFMYRKVLVTR